MAHERAAVQRAVLGDVAQLVERQLCKLDVRSSSLLISRIQARSASRSQRARMDSSGLFVCRYVLGFLVEELRADRRELFRFGSRKVVGNRLTGARFKAFERIACIFAGAEHAENVAL